MGPSLKRLSTLAECAAEHLSCVIFRVMHVIHRAVDEGPNCIHRHPSWLRGRYARSRSRINLFEPALQSKDYYTNERMSGDFGVADSGRSDSSVQGSPPAIPIGYAAEPVTRRAQRRARGRLMA